MLLSDAIEELCIATRANGRSPRTVQAYREKLGYLLDFLGDVVIEGISIHDLRRYIAHQMDRQTRWADHPLHSEIEGALSPFTIAGRIRALKRLFNWLQEEGILEHNPAKRIKTPQPKRREPKGISQSDFVALLATTEGDSTFELRDRALILFLGDTGCRVGGLCGLRVQDLHLDMGLATVTEKRDKTRLVPFTEPTAAALRAWLKVRPEDKGPWVFVGLAHHSKGALSSSGVLHMLRRRAKQAGVTGPVNPHAFRHAFARHFLLDGGDLGTLSELMGHEDVGITKQYYAIFTIKELQAKHREHSLIAQIFGGDEDGD